jgi:hypothetical protein
MILKVWKEGGRSVAERTEGWQNESAGGKIVETETARR